MRLSNRLDRGGGDSRLGTSGRVQDPRGLLAGRGGGHRFVHFSSARMAGFSHGERTAHAILRPNWLAAMRRSRYQPDWFLDFAKTAAILPCLRRLARNQCGFSAGGRLSGFGAVWRGAWRCSISFC
jgi:hypothetical protein